MSLGRAAARRCHAWLTPLLVLSLLLPSLGGPGSVGAQAPAPAVAGRPEPGGGQPSADEPTVPAPRSVEAVPRKTRQAPVGFSRLAGAALGNLRFVTPVRVVDTRAAVDNGTGPVGFDGAAAGCAPVGVAPVPAGGTRRFRVAGCAFGATAFPADATGLLLNVTVIQAQASGGFVTVFPADVPDAGRPNASTVNPSTAVAANFTAVGLPAAGANTGAVAVYSSNQADLAIDVVGYYSPTNSAAVGNLVFVNPTRVVDTRAAIDNGTGPIGFDGATGNAIGTGQLVANQTRLFRVAGKSFGATAFPADTAGLLAHVTIVQPQASGGFATLLPGDATGRPGTSTVNPSTSTAFNSWAVGVPASGNVGLFSTNAAHVIVDVVGYYSPSAPAASSAGDLTLVTPVRVLDTRATDPPAIATTGFQGNGTPIAAGAFAPGASGETRRYLLGGKAFGAGANAVTFPADVTGVLANVTMVQAAASGGFATVFPGDVPDAARPNASTVNPVTAVAASFWATGVPPGGGSAGQVAVFTTNPTHMIVDVVGYFRAPTVTAPTPVDPTTATDITDSTKFLYTGANPVQTGVISGTIAVTRTAVLRGRVLGRDSAPLPGATVTVLGHPEFGQTVSRVDGMWDMAVNGGGPLTAEIARDGFLTAQRTVDVAPRDWTVMPDVVLVAKDAPVSTVSLDGGAADMQVHRGAPVTDSSGTRQATVLFPPGTSATMQARSGARRAMATGSVRATEFTVGATGPDAMPGELPPVSAYTYAVELSLDEADAAGATSVSFNQPVIFYLENFLGMNVGIPVPVGYYDREKARWVATESGRVVKLVGVTGGLADLDVTGDGAADPGQYATLGITNAERQRVAALYTVGQSLWRARVTHFTPFDCNWASTYSDPEDALRPNLPDARNTTERNENNPQQQDGWGTLDLENQLMHERLPLAGTPFSLNYGSDRVPAAGSSRTVTVPLTGATIPSSLQSIELDITVDGTNIKQSFAPAPNLTYTYLWPGIDAFGRAVLGHRPVLVKLGYTYLRTWVFTPNFGQYPEGTDPASLAVTRREPYTLWTTQSREVIGLWDARGQAFGLWSLDVHHVYQPDKGTLFMGDGGQRSVRGLTYDAFKTMAGNGQTGYAGDGGPATNGRFGSTPSIAFAPDGSLYIADLGNRRLRRVAPDGTLSTVGGNGTASFSGDGFLATQMGLSPTRVVFGPDGLLYMHDQVANRIFQLGPDNRIRTVAGNGSVTLSGDGGPATAAGLGQNCCAGFAIGPDGSIYLDSDQYRIRRVGPDGVITTIAGDGTPPATATEGDGGFAKNARVNANKGLAVGPDGSVYLSSNAVYGSSPFATFGRVRRIGTDGIITTFAGDGFPCCTEGEGGPAKLAHLIPGPLAVGRDGSVYIGASGGVLRVGPNGILTRIAGRGAGAPAAPPASEGAPTTAVDIPSVATLAVSPDDRVAYVPDGVVLIRGSDPALPPVGSADINIASEDGSQVFRFDPKGRHLDTRHALTGGLLYQFAYDAAGRLTGVTDGDGNVATIERNAAGFATAVVGPYGHRTALTMDANGFLTSLVNPANERTSLEYSGAGGLLTAVVQPAGQRYTFTYDGNARLVRADDPAGGFTTLARADLPLGQEVTVTTGAGRVTKHRVEKLATGERRVRTTNEDGTVTERLFGIDGTLKTTLADGSVNTVSIGPDPRFGVQSPVPVKRVNSPASGITATTLTTRTASLATPTNPFSLTRLTQTVALNGATTVSVYDGPTRTTTTTSAAGRVGTVTVDPLGRTTRAQAPGDEPVTLAYDGRGRLASRQAGQGGSARTTTYAYNGPFLAGQTDPLNRTTAYTLDAVGRRTAITRPDGQTVARSFDTNGNLTGTTPVGRAAHTLGYNAVNQLTSYTPPAPNNSETGPWLTTATRNADQQITALARPGGVTVASAYDAAGRLSSVSTASAPTVGRTYAYNATTGHLTSVAVTGGNTLTFGYSGSLMTSSASSGSGQTAGTVTQSYDNNLRVASQSVNAANPLARTYDPDGLLLTSGGVTVGRTASTIRPGSVTVGGVQETWTFNTFGELTDQTVSLGATPVYHVTYTRDGLGRVQTKSETVGAGAPAVSTYAYDDATTKLGRLVSVTAGATTGYAYDANGNRTAAGSANATYDNQDRLTGTTGGTPTTYTYTANGDLATKVRGATTTTYAYDGTGALRSVAVSAGATVAYAVDGNGRRTSRSVNNTVQQRYLWGPDGRLVAELDAANAVVSRFVYAGGRVPTAMIRAGTTYRIITDQLGSVRLVVNAATGATAQQVDYDAWGNVLNDTSPLFQPFGFAGGLYDPQTGLVRFGARDYDPEVGRWTAKDPLVFDGRDANLYSYVGNDPVNGVDPSGLLWWLLTPVLLDGGAAFAEWAILEADAALLASGEAGILPLTGEIGLGVAGGEATTLTPGFLSALGDSFAGLGPQASWIFPLGLGGWFFAGSQPSDASPKRSGRLPHMIAPGDLGILRGAGR